MAVPTESRPREDKTVGQLFETVVTARVRAVNMSPRAPGDCLVDFGTIRLFKYFVECASDTRPPCSHLVRLCVR